ncbi:hypothetical protein GTY86_32110 [Streptomyces sp. SID5770]|uniref:hypothetical protein n=1 Tax=Streptomyces sp. SID5770 TaxID=2690308 RepID=UPI00136A755C|nr:hypothetical protein [Streptomyces sp. SID5770]MZE55841.1 hypothetical protein [Streptomyces sp. SID5770]
MIRVVTAERLRRLLEEAEQARADVAEANARASDLHRRHVARVDHLNGCVDSAESDAAILREHVAEFEAALKKSTAEAAALREELEDARRVAAEPMGLLLRNGAPHSVHASVQAAKDYAATLGADPSGWVPSGTARGPLTGWSIMHIQQQGAGS